MCRWRFALDEEEYQVICQALPPDMPELGCPASAMGAEVGWEEMAEAALAHLLSGCLAHNAREAGAGVPPLAGAQNTQRLRRHVALVVERLGKGRRLSWAAPPPA